MTVPLLPSLPYSGPLEGKDVNSEFLVEFYNQVELVASEIIAIEFFVSFKNRIVKRYEKK